MVLAPRSALAFICLWRACWVPEATAISSTRRAGWRSYCSVATSVSNPRSSDSSRRTTRATSGARFEVCCAARRDGQSPPPPRSQLCRRSRFGFCDPRFDELGTTLAFMALAMPFMALADVWSSAVRGLGAVARSQYPASIVQHLLVGISLVTIVFVVGENGGAVSAAAAFLFATIGAMTVAQFFSAARIAPASADIAAQLLSR